MHCCGLPVGGEEECSEACVCVWVWEMETKTVSQRTCTVPKSFEKLTRTCGINQR